MSSKTKLLNQPIVLRYMHLLLIGIFALFLSACGGESGDAQSDMVLNDYPSEDNVLSDRQIAHAVYFDKRIPDGFYHEKLPNDSYYVTSHIKNIDLLALVDRAGVSAYELTSNDFVEAMSWSEQSEGYQSSYKQLVDNKETLLYHQFSRVDPANPDIVHLHRVLKANVLDRRGIDDEYKGRMTTSNMASADVKLIIEYLWTFTIDNNYGNAVITSVTTESTNEYIHTLKQAKLNMSFSNECDTIELSDVRYIVSKVSGFIMKEIELLRVIPVRRLGDSLEICT